VNKIECPNGGGEIWVGDAVWVETSRGFELRRVGKIHERKIEYDKPDSYGYIGVRLANVHKRLPTIAASDEEQTSTMWEGSFSWSDKIMSKEGKQEFALALLLWFDFKKGGKAADVGLMRMVNNMKEHLGVAKEFDELHVKLGPFVITQKD
jgi:hypothetical protein